LRERQAEAHRDWSAAGRRNRERRTEVIEVIMPKLGLTMEEGTIVRWLKEEGDPVEKDEILFEVQTDKVVMEVESPASGILGKILVGEDETVPVVTVVAYVVAPGEEMPEVLPVADVITATPMKEVPSGREEIATQARATPAARRLARDRGIGLASVAGSGKDGMIVKEDVLATLEVLEKAEPEVSVASTKVKASPAARRVAREQGVALREVRGSGVGGRVVEQDVLDFVAARQSLALEGEFFPLDPVRKLMAERMVQSFSTAPHFYLGVEVTAAALVELRERLVPVCEEKAGVRLTFTDMLVRLLAAALGDHPLANATWEEGQIRLYRQISIGLATAVDEGLVVPVIKRADQLRLTEIALARRGLAEKAAAGKLTLDEVTGGTFTLTNLGMLGVDVFQAIINPPQSAILATGRIAERPVVEEGNVVARPTIYLTLSVDHRVLDGATAARFLQDVQTLIEDPYRLLLKDIV
jgi:pyruvate dehydrogenase E2 component (dihydrolipoamide acetyltransferase)